MNKNLGVMQGRLSPALPGRVQGFPGIDWKSEFEKASLLGFGHIEWIYEHSTLEQNPMRNSRETDLLRDYIQRSRVKVFSVCADYFMDKPYLQADVAGRKLLQSKLADLVIMTSRIGAKHIDLPFVDQSKISGEGDFPAVKEFISVALKEAARHDVDICLETNLGPEEFRALLDFIDHPSCGANYDVGNSASLGYDTSDEFAAYGENIRTVHIKDRVLGGGTVPLGQGDVDFDDFFSCLREIKYGGHLVLQAARQDISEEKTMMSYMSFLDRYLLDLDDSTKA